MAAGSMQGAAAVVEYIELKTGAKEKGQGRDIRVILLGASVRGLIPAFSVDIPRKLGDAISNLQERRGELACLAWDYRNCSSFS